MGVRVVWICVCMCDITVDGWGALLLAVRRGHLGIFSFHSVPFIFELGRNVCRCACCVSL
jgi:hypothetical protein